MPLVLLLALIYWLGSRGEDPRKIMTPTERFFWILPLLLTLGAGFIWEFQERYALMVAVPVLIGFWSRVWYLHRTANQSTQISSQ